MKSLVPPAGIRTISRHGVRTKACASSDCTMLFQEVHNISEKCSNTNYTIVFEANKPTKTVSITDSDTTVMVKVRYLTMSGMTRLVGGMISTCKYLLISEAILFCILKPDNPSVGPHVRPSVRN